MDNNTAAAASVVATLIMVYGLVLIAVIAFMVWLWWRIFAKAGYNGALSLLNFVPGVGHLICLVILAFGRWPIEDQLPPIAPGTAVTPQV